MPADYDPGPTYARIQELEAIGARDIVERAGAMAAHLFAIGYESDPAALSRVVAVPCSECWPPEAIAKALDRVIAGLDARAPNLREPRPDCAAPASAHVSVEITPTDQLSGADRALFLAAKQGRYGIEVTLEDRQAARAELHRLLGLITSKSESKSLNVSATLGEVDTSAEALLAAFNKARLSTAPVAIIGSAPK